MSSVKQELKYQLWGWILFIVCALIFIVSSIHGGYSDADWQPFFPGGMLCVPDPPAEDPEKLTILIIFPATRHIIVLQLQGRLCLTIVSGSYIFLKNDMEEKDA
ncbi:MAG: hypothetical protein JRH03_11200 [Deltaproteobacteria bacterium]|nr:hypothetical protein [Deltaproteobacteria bacterium]